MTTDFADINKRYKNQLVQVKVRLTKPLRTQKLTLIFLIFPKVAEMANNDLEKYGKALDKCVCLS